MKLSVLGRSTYVYTAGRRLEPQLPSIVFIHGGEQDHSTWALQCRYFAYPAAMCWFLLTRARPQLRYPARTIADLAGW